MASFTLADHMGVESFPLGEKITAKLEKLTAAPKLAGKITGTGCGGLAVDADVERQLPRGQSRAQERRRGVPAAESAAALGAGHVLDSGGRFDQQRRRAGARDRVRAAVHRGGGGAGRARCRS